MELDAKNVLDNLEQLSDGICAIDDRDVAPNIRIDEIWYFIIATLVFTFIGIISVLTYLGV